MLRALGERGINELHVEAGAKLNGALLAAGLIDEFLVYLAPTVLGDPARGMFEASQDGECELRPLYEALRIRTNMNRRHIQARA